MTGTEDRYNGGAIAFHWTIAVLVIANLALGLLHESVPRDWQVMPVHKSIGITVLFLSLARLAWRLTWKAPHYPDNMPGWERIAAKATHWTFYALMILVPLSGWIMSSGTRRRPLEWFFLFDIPYLPLGDAAADAAHEVHELLPWLWIALLVLHVGAALNHHFRRRDRVLARMLPLADRNG